MFIVCDTHADESTVYRLSLGTEHSNSICQLNLMSVQSSPHMLVLPSIGIHDSYMWFVLFIWPIQSIELI